MAKANKLDTNSQPELIVEEKMEGDKTVVEIKEQKEPIKARSFFYSIKAFCRAITVTVLFLNKI